MYRVELKGLVRNYLQREIKLLVPNVPCGVESGLYPFVLKDLVGFLMYRVELKVTNKQGISVLRAGVPNVPCGVERSFLARCILLTCLSS